jgi:hypothetical protein
MRLQDEDDEEDPSALTPQDMHMYEGDEPGDDEDQEFNQLLEEDDEGLSNLKLENDNKPEFRVADNNSVISAAAKEVFEPPRPGSIYVKFSLLSNCNNMKIKNIFRLLFDTGASNSLVPYAFYEQLVANNAIVKQENMTVLGQGAAGIELDL